ncbi:MAG TPA: SEC-C metal-binding domain-containing protein [Vicinamibacterales bacterium]|nr:SEC-C metal-binding domain-containing protein [Vicinamibacterales bacterium]
MARSSNAVGRNDKCPCGSGKKHKYCCAGKAAGNNKLTTVMLLVVAAAIAAALLASVFSEGEAGGGRGRVWSAEHGHYHEG